MMQKTLGSMGEFGFLRDLRKKLATKSPFVALGAGDDAAVLRPRPGRELVFTTDLMVEGRHFDRSTLTYRRLGAKAMAVNLSDVAAMGAEPRAAVVSLGAPAKTRARDLTEFSEGLIGEGRRFGCPVVGGDTVGSERLVVNVAMLGEVERGKALRRDAAKIGDVLLVTGTLGDSGGGFHSLRHPGRRAGEVRPFLHLRHLAPEPRCEAGRFLVRSGLSRCAIDVSDGLSSEVNHLCEESGVGAEVHEEALPVSLFLRYYCQECRLDPLRFVLDGGEDYELLFTVPLDRLTRLLKSFPRGSGTFVSPIGRIVPKSRGAVLLDLRGRRRALRPGGYDHFSRT